MFAMSNTTYDRLKWVDQIVLPSLATLYFALASIWGFPFGDKVVGSIAAVTAFLGALLGISSSSYTGDGELVVEDVSDDKVTYSLVIPGYPEKLMEQDTVVLKVKRGTE